MEGTATATTDVATGMWSRVLIDRPYVVPAGKIGAYASYNIAKVTIPPVGTFPGGEFTGDGLGIGAGYGVTDKITVGGQYGFDTGIIGDGDFGIGEGTLGLIGNFQLVHDGKLFVAANADVSLDFCGSNNMGDCGLATTIHAGLGARYNLAPQMAVYTGAPYGPGSVGQHLSISLESDGPITFALPIGFMYQATPELNLHVETNLATIEIANAGNQFFGADIIPLAIGGLYSVNRNLDVVGMFSLADLKEAAFDFWSLQLGIRYYN
jgi:hypothetical protein